MIRRFDERVFYALMFIVLLIGCACAQSKSFSLSQVDAARAELRPFLDAIASVESGADDSAVGDNGKAIGRYQVWRVYWQDALQACPELKGSYKDCVDKDYAERVMCAYLLRYCPKAVGAKDYQVLARIHNGGPRGATKRATLPYWVRVKKVLG